MKLIFRDDGTPGILGWIIIIPTTLVGAIMMMTVFAMMLEGFGRHYEDIDRCKKSASTPYEYHRC